MFPASRDDLVECMALLRAVRSGDLDRIVVQDAPNDVLAQQIVAETSCREYTEDELFAVVRRAWPYRDLERPRFDAVVTMLADGFATKRGRRGALIYRDEVQQRLRGRRGSRLLALTSGGAIPEVADYRMVLEPDDTFIGTLNEDFAIESMAGDVIQLGNMSWRVLQVGAGVIRVADAKGAPPNIPFWLGEAPARSDELSMAVSRLRGDIDVRLQGGDDPGIVEPGWPARRASIAAPPSRRSPISRATRATLGVVPTQDTLVLERFFDESGGMQLVLHSPFGSRINKAWGLALRKRFCRQFNFELQAAATEDALLLSLGPQHSFPLADVFRYLHPATVEDVLVQALLDAPMFETRWRWNTTIALAVPRFRGGRKVPPPLQRMLADDLLAAVFPDAAACLENIPGDRQLPDHPLVAQTVRDCLDERDGRGRPLAHPDSYSCRRAPPGHARHAGTVAAVARDPEREAVRVPGRCPARGAADAGRARTAGERTGLGPGSRGARCLGHRARARRRAPRSARRRRAARRARSPRAFFPPRRRERCRPDLFAELSRSRRAALVGLPAGAIWIAADRLPELTAVHPVAARTARASACRRAGRLATWTRDARHRRAHAQPPLDGRTDHGGGASRHRCRSPAPTPTPRSSRSSPKASCCAAASAARPMLEWCDRRLLARIHRYTLNRLRAEIEPITAADFQRFLFAWHGVDPSRTTWPASTAFAACCRCSTASNCRPAPGNAPCCRPASSATTRRGSTCCASRARRRGRG